MNLKRIATILKEVVDVNIETEQLFYSVHALINDNETSLPVELSNINNYLKIEKEKFRLRFYDETKVLIIKRRN